MPDMNGRMGTDEFLELVYGLSKFQDTSLRERPKRSRASNHLLTGGSDDIGFNTGYEYYILPAREDCASVYISVGIDYPIHLSPNTTDQRHALDTVKPRGVLEYDWELYKQSKYGFTAIFDIDGREVRGVWLLPKQTEFSHLLDLIDKPIAESLPVMMETAYSFKREKAK